MIVIVLGIFVSEIKISVMKRVLNKALRSIVLIFEVILKRRQHVVLFSIEEVLWGYEKIAIAVVCDVVWLLRQS